MGWATTWVAATVGGGVRSAAGDEQAKLNGGNGSNEQQLEAVAAKVKEG